MKKCKWFSDKELASVLMIDDLNYGYMDIDFRGFGAHCDWGYGCKRENSIYSYFEKFLLNRYPEIKFTVFLPFGVHSLAMVDTNYLSFSAPFDNSDQFIDLLRCIIKEGNELAFHGEIHGSKISEVTYEESNTEFLFITEEECKEKYQKAKRIWKEYFGCDLYGGKFPGYRYNAIAESLLANYFKWWALDYKLFSGEYAYDNGLLYFPANFSPTNLKTRVSLREFIKIWKMKVKLEKFLRQGNIFSIQEHFLSTKPNGKRQMPNLYDDMAVLNQLYAYLRNFDVWYATCTEIARYVDSYEYSRLTKESNDVWKISYSGTWNQFCLSVKSESKYLKDIITGRVLQGVRKNNAWVFPQISPGEYQEL